MKLRLTILFFSVLFTHFIQAQIVFSPVYRKFNKDSQARFYIDRIIDARIDTSTLVGTVIDTVARTIERVEYEKSVSSSLLETLNFAIDKHSKAIPLTIRINYMEYGKRQIKKKEKGVWVYFDIELFIQKDGKYFKFGSEQRAFEGINPSGIDAVDFSNLTWYAWKEVLGDYIFKFSSKPINEMVYSDSTLLRRRVFSEVLDTDKIKEGIYGTYEGFLKNKPWLTPNLKYSDKGEFMIIDPVSGKEERIKSSEYVWAIFYRGQLFYAFKNKELFTRYQYVPLERFGTTFEIAGFSQKTYNQNLIKYQMRGITSNTITNIFGSSFSLGYVSNSGFNSLSSTYIFFSFSSIQTFGKLMGGARENRFILNPTTGQLEKIHFTNLNP